MTDTKGMTTRVPLALLTGHRLGRYDLPTRMIMAPMTRNRARHDGVPSESMITYYAQRASAALIVSEATAVSAQGVGMINMPGIYDDDHIDGWKKVTTAVHQRGGRIFVQLFHAGRVSHPLLQLGGAAPVAPSAIGPRGTIVTTEGRQTFSTPRALTTAELPGVVDQFATAAENALTAGFDGVELHGANGYLLDQFLRDGTNHRTDAYGGSTSNRVRFLVEVAQATAAVVGPERTGIRLSPLHAFNDMYDSRPDTTFTSAVRSLDRLGLAYLHMVEQNDAPIAGPHFDPSRLRHSWTTAYVANGGYDRTSGEAAIRSGVDFVSFGKLFLANPDLPRRFETNATLNEADRSSYYGGTDRGYIDYPSLETRILESARD
jgi:N-ethylmaleimide reductase